VKDLHCSRSYRIPAAGVCRKYFSRFQNKCFVLDLFNRCEYNCSIFAKPELKRDSFLLVDSDRKQEYIVYFFGSKMGDQPPIFKNLGIPGVKSSRVFLCNANGAQICVWVMFAFIIASSYKIRYIRRILQTTKTGSQGTQNFFGKAYFIISKLFYNIWLIHLLRNARGSTLDCAILL